MMMMSAIFSRNNFLLIFSRHCLVVRKEFIMVPYFSYFRGEENSAQFRKVYFSIPNIGNQHFGEYKKHNARDIHSTKE